MNIYDKLCSLSLCVFIDVYFAVSLDVKTEMTPTAETEDFIPLDRCVKSIHITQCYNITHAVQALAF